jgi:hypothetical protein
MYEELIEDVLKELSNNYYVDNQYPNYQEYMALAQLTYWKAKSQQICCKLDVTVRLPECIEKVAHDFIRANGYSDDEIPAAYCDGGGCTINVPTQRGTQWSPESLSDVDHEEKMVAASTKSAKSVSASKSVSNYKSDNEDDEKMLLASLHTNHPSVRDSMRPRRLYQQLEVF